MVRTVNFNHYNVDEVFSRHRGAMSAAVESLEQPVQQLPNLDHGKIVANELELRKVG